MDLYLVRHGLSVGNRDGRVQSAETELAPAGLQQAAITGRWLARHFAGAGHPVAALYSSDLRRAWQTATIISEHLGRAPIPDPGLREKYAGDAEGRALTELRTAYPELLRGWHNFDDLGWGWPGGETRGQLRERTMRALVAIIARHQPGDAVVVVTHGGPIWAYLSGAVPNSPPLTDSPDHIANCSITHVQVPADGAASGVACLRALNQIGHLVDE